MARLTAEDKAQRAARAAIDKKAIDVVVLDVQGLSSVADYFTPCAIPGGCDRKSSSRPS